MKAEMGGYTFEIAGLDLSPEDKREIQEPVEFQDVTLTRGRVEGRVEGDENFYDWARRTMAEHERQAVTRPDYDRVRLVHYRRWLWPRIWDMFDVRQKPCSPSYDGKSFHCEFEFARRVAWPWYKALGWWVWRGIQRFWHGPDKEQSDE